jgi:LAS superfamily LD-carboxypeptidase LdcB
MPRIRKFLKSITLTQEILAAVLIAIIAFVLVASSYGYARIVSLSSRVAMLDAELASSSARFSSTLSDATTSFSNALQTESQNIKNQLGGVQDQVGVIGGAVTDLKKLTGTDQELLAKYSKVFFLSENYAPVRLVAIPDENKYVPTKDLQIIPQVLSYLEKMLAAAKADGVDLYIDSAYRSFVVQNSLKNQYVVTYGAGTANSFSADQGYSEHQLGTTLDFITTGTGGQLIGFDKRPAYDWLMKNAYRFGFVLSYPKNNGYYIFEPWHWRFVGVKLATDLHDKGNYFYQMDQRAIDEYLSSFFD